MRPAYADAMVQWKVVLRSFSQLGARQSHASRRGMTDYGVYSGNGMLLIMSWQMDEYKVDENIWKDFYVTPLSRSINFFTTTISNAFGAATTAIK